MAHEGEREHSLDLDLREGAQDADQHRQQRGHHEERRERGVGEQQRLDSDDRVDADLGEQACEDGRHGCRSRRVGVGQPTEHREDRCLDAEGDQQHELQEELFLLGEFGEAHGEVREVHGACGAVDRGE